MAMKIGIAGSARARGLTRTGHKVRAVGKDKQTLRETASWGDLVMLAAPFGSIDDVVRNAGNALVVKAGLDVTNALDAKMSLAVGFTTRCAEELGYGLNMGTQIGFKMLRG